MWKKTQKERQCKRLQKPMAFLLALLITASSLLGQPLQAEAALNEGSPWVDYSLKENLSADLKTDVTDDFYLAVNKDWLLDTQIRPGYSKEYGIQEIGDEVIANAKAILEDTTIKGKDAELIRSLYDAVLDWDARNKAGVKPIKPTVKAIQKVSSIKELSDLICTDNSLTLGMRTLVSIENGVSLDDSSSYITYVSGESFLLGDAAEYTKRTELGDRYYKANRNKAVTMLKRLGYTSKEANAMFERVLKFEKKLAKVSYTSEDTMAADFLQRAYNVKSRTATMKLMKNFPLKRFAKAMGYYDSKRFCVENPAYLAKVDELYTKKNLSVIKEYLIVHYVMSMAGYLDKKAYDLCVKTSNTINGADGQVDEKEYAYGVVTSMLSVPMQKVYLSQNNAAEKKEVITKLCEEMVAEYRQMLSETTWISDQTKEKAIEKLDALKINAVYPDRWPDYSGLKLKGKSYMDCCKAIWRNDSKQNQALTNGKVDKELWGVNTLDLNAYYMCTDNSINIMLGILGGDMYRDDMSVEEMYAGIGTVIGHEISHAFDTNGAQFDKNGNLVNCWTEEDLAEFQKRAAKLAAYYDKILVFDGEYVRGVNVQSEAIADITGMDCMLRLAKHQDNFDYDKFFRQYAKAWKIVSSREFENFLLTQDVHPLNYLRVNVTVQQFDEFYDTYHVQKDDKMYLAPEDRLTIW